MSNRGAVIKKCEELITAFNPVTHSIDTHVYEKLQGKIPHISEEDKLFIQNVVYGWNRERRMLECTMNNFFGDNAAFVARVDKTLYTIFSYMAIYMLDDIGFPTFKEYALSQDPTKMFTLLNYIFNKDVLWSCLRADWMKVNDLPYVEDEIIAGIEMHIPEASKFMLHLQEKAQGLAATLAAKEAALKAGTAGLGSVQKNTLTVPESPKLSKPRPPKMPSPLRIDQKITVNEVPSYLDRTSLADLEEQRRTQLEETRRKVLEKYGEKYLFHLNTTKGGRNIEDVRNEIEEERAKELQFDRSFVNEPPDYTSIPAKVRLNVASILREDSLYKKQQARDAQILKAYEEELRDPSEFYAWQQAMREQDELQKLQQVAYRREQAKLSAEEAKEAMEHQKEENRILAKAMREEAEEIRIKKAAEIEQVKLRNREVAESIIAVRDIKPKEAKEKVIVERIEQGKELREELERKRIEREEQDRLEEERRADKIRQLKAVNTVHKKHIVVFDPTEAAGIGLMSEMSYMEMKERLEMEKQRVETQIVNKKQEIVEQKEKKAKELEIRSQGILRARQTKAEAKRAAQERVKEAQRREEEMRLKAREIAAAALDEELTAKREEKKREQDALRAEAERIKRQQQYLGVAKGRVEETRAEQLLLGQERIAKTKQVKVKREAVLREEAAAKDRANRDVVIRANKIEKKEWLKKQADEVVYEHRQSVEKHKEEYLTKKLMVKTGHEQHERTRNIVTQSNLYAARIAEESLERSLKMRK